MVAQALLIGLLFFLPRYLLAKNQCLKPHFNYQMKKKTSYLALIIFNSMKYYSFFLILLGVSLASQTKAQNTKVLPTDTIFGTPCIRIEPKTPMFISTDKQQGSGMKFISFRNMAGGKVNYKLALNFIRFASDTANEPFVLDRPTATPEVLKINQPPITPASKLATDTTLSQYIQYVDEGQLSYAFGSEDIQTTTSSYATKFKAGPNGFNVSSVGTWFVGDYSTEGVIAVEVRAGGDNIENAVSLVKDSVYFKVGINEENGKMYQIKLSKEASVYPNEDFYLIVSYPNKITKPQGCAINSTIQTVPGRYLTKINGGWVDVQRLNNFDHCGWVMNVAETTPQVACWLKLLSTPTGMMWEGWNQNVRLFYDAQYATLGTQVAYVTITTDDYCQSVINFPIVLHVNEAPHFYNNPEKIALQENETTTYEVQIVDNEKDKYTLTPTKGAKVLKYKFENDKLTLIVAPIVGDVGSYQAQFKATDSKGASRNLDLVIDVTSMKSDLEYTFEENWFMYSHNTKKAEYNINKLFRFADGRKFTYQIDSKNKDILLATAKNDTVFSIEPLKIGETMLYFVITDEYGKKLTCLIPASVGMCQNASFMIRQKWGNVLFVDNAKGDFVPEGYQWYKNNQPIDNATKQYYSAGETNNDQLDTRATYYVRLVTAKGDTIYTCPQYPLKDSPKELAQVFPNPIIAGETLHLVTNFEYEEAIVHVQIFSLSGKLLKNDSFQGKEGKTTLPPLNKGLYIIKLSNGKESAVKNLLVK